MTASIQPLELFRRQFFQLIDPEQLTLPSNALLRSPKTQAQIYDGMFNEPEIAYPAPERYRFRVLKRLVNALEQAIVDPDEDEISDDISSCLALYMIKPLPSEITAAQRKSYVTYTAPYSQSYALHITLLESPSLLASSGTTGFRTWEAALFLGAYLASPNGRRFVDEKNIIELGAGTGFLSMFCAKHLGAQCVLATDGSREVITDLRTNLDLNQLEEGEKFRTGVQQWGHTLIDGIKDCRETGNAYDLVLGADVTYDIKSIPSLIATMRDLFELYPRIDVLISATVRNEQTVDCFIQASLTNGYTVKTLDVPLKAESEQMGFFIPSVTAIRIFLITKEGTISDPLAS